MVCYKQHVSIHNSAEMFRSLCLKSEIYLMGSGTLIEILFHQLLQLDAL